MYETSITYSFYLFQSAGLEKLGICWLGFSRAFLWHCTFLGGSSSPCNGSSTYITHFWRCCAIILPKNNNATCTHWWCSLMHGNSLAQNKACLLTQSLLSVNKTYTHLFVNVALAPCKCGPHNTATCRRWWACIWDLMKAREFSRNSVLFPFLLGNNGKYGFTLNCVKACW